MTLEEIVKRNITRYVIGQLGHRKSVAFYRDVLPRFWTHPSAGSYTMNSVNDRVYRHDNSLGDIAEHAVNSGCGGKFVAIGVFSPEDLSYEWFFVKPEDKTRQVARLKSRGFEVDSFFENGERIDYDTGEKIEFLSADLGD